MLVARRGTHTTGLTCSPVISKGLWHSSHCCIKRWDWVEGESQGWRSLSAWERKFGGWSVRAWEHETQQGAGVKGQGCAKTTEHLGAGWVGWRGKDGLEVACYLITAVFLQDTHLQETSQGRLEQEACIIQLLQQAPDTIQGKYALTARPRLHPLHLLLHPGLPFHICLLHFSLPSSIFNSPRVIPMISSLCSWLRNARHSIGVGLCLGWRLDNGIRLILQTIRKYVQLVQAALV